MLKSVKVVSFGLMSLLLIAVMVSFITGGNHANAALNSAQSGKTTVFWLQTMDSCRQAVPGAHFRLQGNGLSLEKGPTLGSKPLTINRTGDCPNQRGNCDVSDQTGCVSWDVPVPSSGSKTYQIVELSAPKGYTPCIMFPECKDGPVTVTLTINSHGDISATAHDVSPDGKAAIWPSTGKSYTGSKTDPAVVHNSSKKKNEDTPTPTPTENSSPTPTPTPSPSGPPGLPPTGSDPNAGN